MPAVSEKVSQEKFDAAKADIMKGLEGVQFYPMYILDVASIRYAQ